MNPLWRRRLCDWCETERISEEMNKKSPTDFTVSELKEKLRDLGLSSAGNKTELISRLIEADPSSRWTEEIPEMPEVGTAMQRDQSEPSGTSTLMSQHERGMEIYRREKELIERELQFARRELELTREMQRLSTMESDQTRRRESTSQDIAKPSLTAIADLLSYFDGSMGNYEVWEKQLRLLKTTYQLPDEHVKVLIGMRLKGKALEWMHSNPQYIELSVETLLSEMREMYDHRPSKVVRRKRFEERVWKREETFHEYVHEKIILGNRVPIGEDEIIDYIIDGIPISSLRDQARIGRFATKASLLQAFEKVTLRDKASTSGAWRGEQQGRGDSIQRQRRGDKNEKGNPMKNTTEKRCFNCGMRNHLSADCPTKVEGPKCFQCGERGHIASKCVKRQNAVRNVHIDASIVCKKYSKEVEINGHKTLALIDTGSDICLVRSDKYIRLGSPRLDSKEIRFRGVGSNDNLTLGEFNANITIDECVYPILIRVVSDTLLNHELIIGTDFLNTIEMTIKAGEISINPLSKLSSVNDDVSEILQINVNPEENDEIDVSHIPNLEYQDKIKKMITTYNPVRSRDIDFTMSIILKDEEPVYQRARRLSASERQQVNTQISEWMRDNIIQPSLSEYASPIVLVKKRDNSVRLCVDYRLLNKKIVKDRYPLPIIEDQLDLLQNARLFSTLDLRNGFFHVRIDERSRKYTAFIVPDGHYEFLRVPFGLCNSPAVFQRFINIVFRDLIRAKVVLTYMDDLIVPSTDYKSGMANLEATLKVASEAGLSINWRKCSFLKRRVEFLGHLIENGSVYPSERKIEAVQKFPEPCNAKQLQSFLGLSGYFRKFVPQYSLIARPLSDLLKANAKYVFGERENDAFKQLKKILSSKPVLNLYVAGAETEVHADASMQGYGAILLQKSKEDNAFHPIYYSSSKTTTAEQKYSSYELEVLAIIKALKKFRVYLIGIFFTIVTDCRAFTATMAKKDLCIRVARWALLLEEFNYKIEHRPGKSMIHVDALSRHPIVECCIVEQQRDRLTVQLKKAQKNDDDVRRVFDRAKLEQIDGFVIRSDLLFKEIDGDLRVVVPKSMQSQIIRQAHEKGHFSIAKTEALLRKDYWIPSVTAKIEKIIRNCVACILAEKKQGKREGFLNPIAKGEVPLDTYHIDHLGPLPSTKKNYKHIFVVIDAFSKFTWLYATKSAGIPKANGQAERVN